MGTGPLKDVATFWVVNSPPSGNTVSYMEIVASIWQSAFAATAPDSLDGVSIVGQRAMWASRTDASKPLWRRRAAIARASTGERWRPPVHPRATVR